MRLFALALVFLLMAPSVSAQDQPSSLRLFLDCEWACDQEFIRSEITLVDFVNDRTASDVHLLVTTEGTGSGGRVFSLAFIGQRDFAALTDTLGFVSPGTATDDERRRGLTNMIENGLVRYLSRTTLAPSIELSLVRPENGNGEVTESIEYDPWNYWVFSVGGGGDVSGEESSDSYSVRGNISANRTTEEWKIRLSANGRYRERNFDIGDDRTVSSISRNGSIWMMVVNSLGDHWSVGGTLFMNTSSERNTDGSVTAGPAIEYNVFPYSESTRREFRFQYGVRLDYRNYDEVTIFNVTEESLLRHSLQAELDMQQTWGEVGFDAEFSHLLTNFDRSLTDSYRLELDFSADVRLARGFSVFFGAGYELIRDQLFLPLSDISEEDILLGTRRLPTGYDFNARIGFNYRFGSIFNNVVNPRFGF
ncbi:MAG: hypothetical protein JJ896_07805 [Rhodothermales bacterium]|nr:hypothetical protein [Rhodothermales bacterium]MBO6779544.1 hypothetical protein [Rhodothermales bacterium]